MRLPVYIGMPELKTDSVMLDQDAENKLQREDGNSECLQAGMH